jgi:hypothetical protein
MGDTGRLHPGEDTLSVGHFVNLIKNKAAGTPAATSWQEEVVRYREDHQAPWFCLIALQG